MDDIKLNVIIRILNNCAYICAGWSKVTFSRKILNSCINIWLTIQERDKLYNLGLGGFCDGNLSVR